MLKEIDNYAVLKSYGIEIDTPMPAAERIPRRQSNMQINGSEGRIYEEEHKRVASEMGAHNKLNIPEIADANQNLLEVKSTKEKKLDRPSLSERVLLNP